MKLTILLLAAWTFMIWSIAYSYGYRHGVYDERVLQTQMIQTLHTLVEERCR